jgi:hypothetical protein
MSSTLPQAPPEERLYDNKCSLGHDQSIKDVFCREGEESERVSSERPSSDWCVPSRGFAAGSHDDLAAALLPARHRQQFASSIMEGLYYNIKYG